ncbi:WD40/YVTN/BNR-like repeat-containing protein, partial [Muriicola sp.]|uniref:WD40/YVTN/BNR-like repeat-containing protein n=1 Tax=Muriicola sp. TaxID=2020856 RepID=UPI003566E0A3
DGLKLRNVGPAFLSGRIADIALHPEDPNVWYVAVGSGGVWKTENAGTTWTPIFDKESTYSIGCLTIDPNNPSTIWVGTGENVGGRHVAWGDGVYKSEDGGSSWKNMGLKASEHISEIIVHPDNPDVIWVAAQGPLWNKGGERGLYKSVDGGATWNKVLGGNEWTGVTDIMLDPRNPDRIYAATWQRHRTVAALMGGGPDSGLHRSEDGGETWEKLSSGLPSSNMGKIGIAISPQQPDVVYAAIELDRTQGAVYRSEDRGASWKKMSNTVSGGTGPHYYQELYASPHAFDRLYLMNVRILTSDDGGKTFVQLREEDKHSDNHAIAFRADDPDYLLVGTDAGIYESFDLAQTWRYIKNLPLTQFYKVAVNNQKPFYHIFGGTQDNGSAGGPSRTDEQQGIRNAHWYKTLGADGHQSATDPVYNHIIYAETQQGGLHRVDLITGDRVFIQPQPRAGEPHERYNWDAPILVSPHKPSRL